MADDYYQTLGVERGATPDQIQKAYRDLARKYHPDLNPDDKTAKEKFQKVQAAFDVLNDADKRAKYDRFGSAFESAGRGPGGGPWPGADGAGGVKFEEFDLGDIFGAQFGETGGGFADILGNLGRGGRAGKTPRRGRDLTHELTVPFATAVLGGEAVINVERDDGRVDTLTVKIPAGIEEGQKIRLRGQGEPGRRNGEAGDILIEIHIAPHPFFQRRGKRLDVQLPVKLSEAVLGAKVDVPTPKGTISLRIPPNTSSGTKLRVKGHGVAPKGEEPGDLFAEVQIMLPKDLGTADQKAVEEIEQRHSSFNPRSDLRW